MLLRAMIFLLFLGSPCLAAPGPLTSLDTYSPGTTRNDQTSAKNFRNLERRWARVYDGTASLEVSSIVSSLETVALLDATSIEADGGAITDLTAGTFTTTGLATFDSNVSFESNVTIVGTATIYSDLNLGDVSTDKLTVSGIIETVSLEADGAFITTLTANTIVATGDIYTKARYDYFATSTKVGWAATPTGHIYIKKIGKTVLIDVNITGTSNTTNITFTVPYTSTSDIATISHSCRVRDNGTWATAPGMFFLDVNSATVNVFIDGTSTNLFTASGAKNIWGQFRYEAQ